MHFGSYAINKMLHRPRRDTVKKVCVSSLTENNRDKFFLWLFFSFANLASCHMLLTPHKFTVKEKQLLTEEEKSKRPIRWAQHIYLVLVFSTNTSPAPHRPSDWKCFHSSLTDKKQVWCTYWSFSAADRAIICEINEQMQNNSNGL